MALILPKGIVVNSPHIERDIERINEESLDLADIAKFWKVYNTTSRRLLDPTAIRLESYWWRIWGSSRRELKAATIARLFAHISDGSSFVPLRGPANRDEGTPLNRNTRLGPGASSTTALHPHKSSRPSTTSSSTNSRMTTVMPHPILKKTRGPSTTGPRPTARFISPHDTEDETMITSSSSTNSHVVVQHPSPPDSQAMKTDKRPGSIQQGKKKGQSFVASTAVKKKRPVIVRRQSSQSSADIAIKDADTAMVVAANESPLEALSQARGRTLQSKSEDSRFSSRECSVGTTQSSKKRSSSKRSTGISNLKATEETTQDCGTRLSTELSRVESEQDPIKDLSQEELQELELQAILINQANSRTRNQCQGGADEVRLRSDEDNTQIMGTPHSLLPDVKGKGAVSLAPTLAAATGHITIDDKEDAPGSNAQKLGKDKSRDPEGGVKMDLFAKRPFQTGIAENSPPALESSLSKSKSQLTLLLEKDRARTGDHKAGSDDKKKRGSKGL